MTWEIWGDGDDDPELLRYWQRQREAQRHRLWLQRQAEIDEERRRQQQLQRRRQIWFLQQREAEEERRREEERLFAKIARLEGRTRCPLGRARSFNSSINSIPADQRDDFVLQIPVDSELGIASSQIPCVDNFEIFPTQRAWVRWLA